MTICKYIVVILLIFSSVSIEVSEKFTILVEAKDHGDVISLSSSTTVVIHVLDGNNHLPIISGQTVSLGMFFHFHFNLNTP